jgi:hypothetical protein
MFAEESKLRKLVGLDNAELNTQNLQRFNVATLQVSFSSPSLRTFAKKLHVFTSALLSLSWYQPQLARGADPNPHGSVPVFR